jgi:hypothetical protein
VAAVTTAKKRKRNDDPPSVFPVQNYRQSTEAMKLFRPLETDRDSKDALQRRIETLLSINLKEDEWRNVVNGRDPNDVCRTMVIGTATIWRFSWWIP